MSMERYSFCFLRYFHEPLSGEFANVGVLLWAPDSSFVGFRCSQKYARISHFFHGFQPRDYRQMISRIETQFAKISRQIKSSSGELQFSAPPESARDLASKVIPHDDGAFQWSISSGGVTDSPADELERLFHEVISRHYDSVDEARRDDSTVYREVYSRAFETPAVKPFITEHEIITPLASHNFQHAWKNAVWNVYQPLSFDLKRTESIKIKAYQWESLTRFLANSPEQPNIYLLLGEPSEKLGQSYQKAKDVLRASGKAILVEENEAADFARELAQRVSSSV